LTATSYGEKKEEEMVVEEVLPSPDILLPNQVGAFLGMPVPRHLVERQSTFGFEALASESGDRDMMPFMRDAVERLIFCLTNDGDERAQVFVKSCIMHKWLNQGIAVLKHNDFVDTVARAALTSADSSSRRVCLALLHGHFSQQQVISSLNAAREALSEPLREIQRLRGTGDAGV
jgi:hypothetical protein